MNLSEPGKGGEPGKLHLIVFSRAPVAGATKTRLTPPLSPEAARDIHVACLNDVLGTVREWRGTRHRVHPHLFITPPASQPAFRAAGVRWPEDFALHNQRGDTLGERMAQAMTKVMGPGDAVLLIGSDLPLLTPDHLDEAARALKEADTVFALTPDGGYWLVGTRKEPAPLFAVGGWGGDSVLERSLAAAKKAGHSVSHGPELQDLDTLADIHAVLAHPAQSSIGPTPQSPASNIPEPREALPLLLRLKEQGMLG